MKAMDKARAVLKTSIGTAAKAMKVTVTNTIKRGTSRGTLGWDEVEGGSVSSETGRCCFSEFCPSLEKSSGSSHSVSPSQPPNDWLHERMSQMNGWLFHFHKLLNSHAAARDAKDSRRAWDNEKVGEM